MDSRSSSGWVDGELSWQLLYTKPRAESWAEANLRKQGFVVLLPRIATRSGFAPLFPRYVFAGLHNDQRDGVIRSTFGVQYVVHCGDKPARVPIDVVFEIRSRMDSLGVVTLDHKPTPDPLFAKRERERVRTLVRLAQAGFRVRLA
jgi:Transcription termination factor nusG